MAENRIAGFNSGFHLRVPGDFAARVHGAARRRGMTASSFVRWAVIRAMQEQAAATIEQPSGTPQGV